MGFLVNPFAGSESYNCFGCCPDNRIGLRMRFEQHGDELVSYWEPDTDYEGWHNVLHGGIQATMIDEIGSWFVFANIGRGGVTSRLDIKYRKPVKMDTGMVKLVARLKENRKRVVDVTVELFDGEGRLCTDGMASYFLFDDETAKEKLFFPGGGAFHEH